MKTYRMNAIIAGALYFLGTAFGIASAVVGGEVVAALVKPGAVPASALVDSLAADPAPLVGGAVLVLLMGISLAAMTVFLYPHLRRDSEEPAFAMVLFRGALEGAWHFVTAASLLFLFALAASGLDRETLGPAGTAMLLFEERLGPAGTLFFVIGAGCLYVSFYRTRLTPRWLTAWGLVGLVPYAAVAWLRLFGMDHGAGFWLQMVLAPQEIVMALWLIVAGFDRGAVARLAAAPA